MVRQNGRIVEDRLDGRALLDGAGEMPNAFDQIKIGSGTALRGLEVEESQETRVSRVSN